MTAPAGAMLETDSASPSTSVSPNTASVSPNTASADPIDAIFDTDDVIQLRDQSIDGETDIGVPDEPAPVKPKATKPLGADRGDGRDAQGRWVRSGPDPDPAVTAAANAATEAPDKAPETTPPAAPAAPAKGDPVPFRYRSMGETKTLDGATMDPEGNIAVPKAHLGTLREAMNALDVVKTKVGPLLDGYKNEIQAKDAKIAEMTAASSAEQQRAAKIIESVTAMMQEPDEEKFLDGMLNIRKGWATRVAEANAEFWKTRANAPRPAAAPAPTTTPNPATEIALPSKDQAIKVATDYAEQFKLGTEFHDLTPANWKQYDEQTSRRPYAFYRPATAEDVQQYGVKLGAVVFDTDQAYADMQAFAKTIRDQRESETRTRALAAANARTTQTSVQTPPRVEGERPQRQPGQSPKTKDEFDSWLNSADL